MSPNISTVNLRVAVKAYRGMALFTNAWKLLSGSVPNKLPELVSVRVEPPNKLFSAANLSGALKAYRELITFTHTVVAFGLRMNRAFLFVKKV